MKLVVCGPENIAPWIYSYALPDYPDPGIAADIPDMGEDDIAALCKATNLDEIAESPFVYQGSGCDVGFPHDAPTDVPKIKSELLKALSAIPTHERWRVAEKWASLRLNNRPNKEELSEHKKLLKIFCEFAVSAQSKQHVLVLIQQLA